MRRTFFLPLVLILLSACSPQPRNSSDKPLIGITCSRSSKGATQLAVTYTEAITKAGGVPVVIPTLETEEEAQAILAAVDGIVFSGGEDVNPAWYGEEIWNETVHIDYIRDHSDSLLARAALATDKPILAICRGEQLINVMLGGSLWQDLPSQKMPKNRHGGGSTHTIGLEEGCILAQLMGPDSLLVNSYHHQAVKDPAPGIHVIAYDEDGIVEAYETDQILAVQFHPEKLVKEGETRWIPLFETFVERCK